jgi:hypothetical protein
VNTIPERVAKGAAFLDEHDPDWWRADVERAIDLVELNLSSCRRCVLGQRCPLEINDRKDPDITPYEAFAVELWGADDEALTEWANEHGFDGLGASEYDRLTHEWTRVITERRAAA